MRRLSFVCLFAFCLFFIVSQISSAFTLLRVDETKINMSLLAETAEVILQVENSSGKTFNALANVELLAPDGTVVANRVQEINVKPNENAFGFILNFKYDNLRYEEKKNLMWYRLHYQIAPDDSDKTAAIEGIVSLSKLQTNIFELQANAPKKVQAGSSVRVIARALNPLSTKPIANLKVEGKIEFDDDEKFKPLTANATTNENGYAILDFTLPRNLEDEDELDLSVKAKRGEFEQEAKEDIEIDRGANLFISTDKTLYQPGQTLNIRALAFDNGNRAIQNKELSLEIRDQSYSVVHRDKFRTSRFGVGNASWQIPNDLRLGDYAIKLELEDDNYEDAEANYSVKISRYDLPNFVVNTKTDKPYYTPDSTIAEAEIRADYLFGQPVKRGTVRVVRENERRWNYDKQKYETDEGDEYKGATDDDGHFTAKINLAEDFKELGNESYNQYRDINYAAYFTDPTTNRTEQRRFDIRITKHPIHIYVARLNDYQNKNLPVEFFVTTNYADGTPVSCDVTVSEGDYDDEKISWLQTIKTNSFGVAKVMNLKAKGGADGNENKVNLILEAKDAQSKTGKENKSFWFNDNENYDVVRVETNKTILRDGEPIEAKITSTSKDKFIITNLTRDNKVIRTQVLQLKDGQANVTFPYSKDLAGLIGVVAFLPGSQNTGYYYYYYSNPIGSQNVLYPRNEELKTNVRMNQAQYKPGDDAVVNFDVRNPNGKPAESALGVVVFDKSVEERARTDSEFGGQFGFYTAMRKLLHDDNYAAGYSLRTLSKLDMSKPLPEGLDVLAELLVGQPYFSPNFFAADTYETSHWNVFRSYLDAQFMLFRETLNMKYKTSNVYPNNETELQRLLYPSGVSIKELLDPWGTLYRYSFRAVGDKQELVITSAGPDKRFETDDDFTVNTIARNYFQQTGEAVNRAVERYNARTGDYIHDATTLKAELKREGIDFDSLRDPWGNPYYIDFYASQTTYNTRIMSYGPSGKIVVDGTAINDDVVVWQNQFNYFASDTARIENALIDEYKATKRFPKNDAELKEFLKNRSVDFNSLRDPWGQNYYASFNLNSQYTNQVSNVTYIRYGAAKSDSNYKVVPVTQQIQYITIRSKGEDKKEWTNDDFNLAYFSRIVSEQSVNETKPQLTESLPTSSGQVGSIAGILTDANGAVIANAVVKVKQISTNKEFSTATNDEGKFTVRNLPVGFYEVRFEAAGFKVTVVSQVLVKQSAISSLNVTLEVGAVQETVTVTSGGAELINSTQSQLSSSYTAQSLMQLPLNGRAIDNLALLTPGVITPKDTSLKNSDDAFGTTNNEQIATPRLREYFPETLVWQPSVETDKQGRAKINFKLADNITTWKMSVVSSTEDGKIGVEEKEFLSFLPFFAEHDPPKILTQGDEISLPVVLRNYTEQTQSVDVEMKPETWFSFLGSQKQRAEVPKSDSKNAVFSFRTVASVDKGKQRVTARATTESDAIEKPVTVHPDGEEKSAVAGDVFTNQVSFDVNLPGDTIKNSPRAQVKIYPNLMAHVAESIEGILHRPYGCGEQTISSTYPNVIILRTDKNGGKVSNRVLEQARKYSKEGYKRLLNYRADDGGFTYWGRGDADVALTAYAVRFLNDAKDVITVDEDVITKAREWLIRKQNADGSWSNYNNTDSSEAAKRQRAILTAYIARVLASSMEKSVAATTNNSSNENQTGTPAFALKKAVSFLRPMVDAFDEPYLLASYALAALEAKETSEANRIIAKLETLSKEEGTGVYWSLESNTPFYGWGLAGRIETTAIVLQALTRSNNRNNTLINRGLLFLLKNKDRYGVWYSTQATINVLDALITLLKGDERAPRTEAANKADIYVGGKFVSSIALPAENELVDPLTVDLSNFIASGNNKIEIRREGANATPASAQVVVNYYIPWDSRESEAVKRTSSSLLRLSVNYDKPQAEITESITCNVEAERIGYRNYGMMLAEIGLPPGADVDRQSLENAMQESGWYFSRYDILPDKVVAYLWPSAGGVKFSFKFKPRYGIKAQTSPSQLYDYYNPEARVVVAPTRFVVK